MKEGRSLQELAIELDRQSKSKKDFLASTGVLSVKTERVETSLRIADKGEFPVTVLAHNQIAEQLEIPKKYYDRVRSDYPTLYDDTVNTLLHGKESTRLIRTLDGKARASLSDKYRRLDNDQAAEIVFKGLSQFTDVEVKSCEVTDQRLYIKAITPKVNFEIAGYGKVCGGMVFKNSEIGLGPLSAEFLIYNEWCKNGAIRPDGRFRKTHIGGRNELGELGATEFLAEDTRQAMDVAFWKQFRDFVKEMFNPDHFASFVEKMKTGLEEPINVTGKKAIEEVQNTFKMSELEGESVLMHLLQGGQMNRFGMANAVTRACQDFKDYDRATEFERIGGQILELPRTQWEAIAG